MSIWWAVAGISIAGLHTITSAGVTGGPNHGEHPFLVTVLHVIVFGFTGRHWPTLSKELYWSGLVLALVLGIITLRHTFDEKRGWLIPMRLAFGLIYAGFLFVLFKRP